MSSVQPDEGITHATVTYEATGATSAAETTGLESGWTASGEGASGAGVSSGTEHQWECVDHLGGDSGIGVSSAQAEER